MHTLSEGTFQFQCLLFAGRTIYFWLAFHGYLNYLHHTLTNRRGTLICLCTSLLRHEQTPVRGISKLQPLSESGTIVCSPNKDLGNEGRSSPRSVPVLSLLSGTHTVANWIIGL